eukprot:252073-Pyramimonas_sp.AAC.1
MTHATLRCTHTASRALKNQFIDSPKEIDIEQPFCYCLQNILYFCKTIQRSDDVLRVNTSTLTVDRRLTWHNRNYLPKQELVLLSSRRYSLDTSALIPLEGILTNTQIESLSTTIDDYTYKILLLQCQNNTSKQLICKSLPSDSSGSMLTETAIIEDQNHHDTIELPEHPHKHKDANSFSDGSTISNTKEPPTTPTMDFPYDYHEF